MYDEARPAFAWSLDNRQQSLRESELGHRLPRNVEPSRPTLHEYGSTPEGLRHPGHPTNIAQWMKRDHPALSVHVVSFTDATLITLSWNHLLFDTLGLQSFLQAWQAVLNNRDDEVPTFVPFEEDPIADMAANADPRDYSLYELTLTGIWFFLFILGYIYEILVHSKEATHMVCFPKEWVENLRKCAMAERLAKGLPVGEEFLSYGDVLLAFWCKTVLPAQRLRPRQPIHIHNAMNMRGLVEQLPIPDKVAYVGNAVLSCSTLTTMVDINSMSVSDLAGRIRESLTQQRAASQVKSMVAWAYNGGGRMSMSGVWNQLIVGWSNWARAKLYDVDFSLAVVKPGLPIDGRRSKIGRPSLIMSWVNANGISVRNGGALIGQDSNGDWWLGAGWTMRAEAWAAVEEALSKS
jgi:hypothetical protein